ncbi:MAG: hypothetical protein RIC19_06305 [Phaeodactylibacter sp.]|uniref:tetratricopeptide repeat protein n=1 Tax=Phaeodactylibacter sp. TaxID=1940289 RepID=UPI0032EC0963
MQIKRSTVTLNPFARIAGFVTACFLVVSTASAQPQQWLDQADSLAKVQQYKAANEKLSEFTQTYPQRKYDLGEAYFKMARNAFRLNDLSLATQYNQQSADLRMKMNPEALGWNEQLSARIQLVNRQPEPALKHLEKAMAFPFFDDPLVPAEIALLKSEILEQMGAYTEAAQAAEEAVAIVEVVEGADAPIMAALHLQSARMYSSQEEWEKAAHASRLSMSVKDSPEAQLQLGKALLAMGNTTAETQKTLNIAQKQGLPPVQIEASLALAQLELANGHYSGVMAQLDSAEPFINEQLGGKGGESELQTGRDYTTAAARAAYLRSCAWLLDSDDHSAIQAFRSAQNGLQILGDTDNQLQQQLLEQGFLSLLQYQEEPLPKDTLYASLSSWTQQYLNQQILIGRQDGERAHLLDLETLKASLPSKTVAVYFLKGLQSDFAVYVFGEALNLQQLKPSQVRQAFNLSDEPSADPAFSVLFSPLEPYQNKIKSLHILAPAAWPKNSILQTPVPSSMATGIWPFRRKAQSLNERYEVLEYAGFIPTASLKSQGKDSPRLH